MKKTIMITGFYGAGNSGDEAMLRNFVFHIRKRVPDSIILVATDKYGTWVIPDVYHISAMDRNKVKDANLFVVGGGDLGLGFGWHILPIAKINKVPCITMGVGINNTYLNDVTKNFTIESLKLFDKIYVRDSMSLSNIRSLGVEAECTSDIAIDIPEIGIPFVKGEKHAVMIVREVEWKDYQKMLAIANSAMEKITKTHFVTIMPFCAEDVTICREVASLWTNRSQLYLTYDPQHHKHIINNANCVVSLGRFHALVYAAEKSIPIIAMAYGEINNYSKIQAWMKDSGTLEYLLDFKLEPDLFLNAWNNMQQDSIVNYKEKIKAMYDARVFANNKQFDEIVSMMT